LRGVCYPKLVVDRVAGDPNNAIARIHDQGDTVALVARHLAIDEKVLQLLLAAKPDRPEPVAWLPAADRESPLHLIGPNACRCVQVSRSARCAKVSRVRIQRRAARG
jgi:hypothetical protein